MRKIKINILNLTLVLALLLQSCTEKEQSRKITDFNQDWKFFLGDTVDAQLTDFNDLNWRALNLPHDWSIEGEFDEDHPATEGGGALPGGIGWYRKTFSLTDVEKDRKIYIEFDGVYMNSEVWINGHYLGKRPYGYISFRYDLTDYISLEGENLIAVKVDNSLQPNSRWYTGSGIYRNVRLVTTNKISVAQWGAFLTFSNISAEIAQANLDIEVENHTEESKDINISTSIYDTEGNVVANSKEKINILASDVEIINTQFKVENPNLWSLENPYQYTAKIEIEEQGKMMDTYEFPFGIRTFEFNSDKGFFLNGEYVKIKGVCNHHDLGCLGAAINTRALERQLEILQEMGCNAIRTSHNPPAPELLDLCDKMGFLVMDEAFDIWKKGKSKYDYSLHWDEWHERDLMDFMKRDRNHPSVIMWSLGNEILEQWDTSGQRMVKELYYMAREMDTTRPIFTGNNPPSKNNNLNIPMVLDLIGFNYAHQKYEDFPNEFPGQKFIATETNSALATRGYYDEKSDELKKWPIAWDKPFYGGNPGNTVSAYDQVSAPWGSTHEETWRIIKKHDFLSGMFIWTGFDYLGEPTPYEWPSRSSYFGVIDLAGFPKDSYYMYKSEWASEPMLHVFPHWNWEKGRQVDVWAYTNLNSVELFLNGKSLGVKEKKDDELHLMWRVDYEPGTIKAIATSSKTTLEKEIKTAGDAYNINLVPDRKTIKADGKDLCFVRVEVTDQDGTIVPDADNLIDFSVEGEGKVVGVDNGNPVSHEPFKASYRKAFHGLCLLVVQSKNAQGEIIIKASSEGLEETMIKIGAE